MGILNRRKKEDYVPPAELKLDEKGREVPDPTPVAIPAGFKRPDTLAEQVRRVVRDLSEQAKEGEYDTFEEAEDFEVGDDLDPLSPYEEVFDPALGRAVTPKEMQENHQAYRDRYLKEAKSYEDWLDRQLDLKEARARERDSRGKSRGAGAPAPASTLAEETPKVKDGSTS